MLAPADFFDLDATAHAALFHGIDHVWEALPRLAEYLRELLAPLSIAGEPHLDGTVSPHAVLHGAEIYVGAGSVVEDGVTLIAPAWIGAGCEVRQGAYLRGQTLVADGAVVGHASELKNAVLLECAKAPHFAYVGDSILGRYVNLGAGTKLSNLAVSSERDPATGQRPSIAFELDGRRIDTGLAKLGAILGDFAQTGCNTVLNPGCLIGPRTLTYANISLPKGYVPADSVVKLRQQHVIVPRERR